MDYDDIPEVGGFKKIPLGKATNYCGQKFGKLTVLYRTEAKPPMTKWVFQCDCGNVVIRDINSVRHCENSSCGCIAKEVVANNFFKKINMNDMEYTDYQEISGFKKVPLGKAENMCGKKFGKLTVLYRTENNKYGAKWVCRCDCGNIVVRYGNGLRSDDLSSCGCTFSKSIHEAALKSKNFNTDINYSNFKEINNFKKIPLGRARNLAGQKIEKLTFLYRTEDIGSYKVTWVCKCDCGNIVKVEAHRVISGKTKSCGCEWQNNMDNFGNNMAELLTKDITGQVFGYLTALYPSKKTSNGTYWRCKCKCGKEHDVLLQALIQGRTKSCGCGVTDFLMSDIKNQRFGKLIALEPTDKRQHNNIVWKCRCDCGNICYANSRDLKQGLILSCGCLKSKGEQKISEILQKQNISYVREKTFNNCKFLDTDAFARFDFYINNKYLIEYDGEQHFSYTGNGWNNKEQYNIRIKRDSFKNQWCKDNNIPLIRIPYTAYDTLSIDDLKLETTKYRVV